MRWEKWVRRGVGFTIILIGIIIFIVTLVYVFAYGVVYVIQDYAFNIIQTTQGKMVITSIYDFWKFMPLFILIIIIIWGINQALIQGHFKDVR